MEGVKCILGTGVPVDVQDQVRHNFIILGIRMRNMPRARCIVQCTCNGKYNNYYGKTQHKHVKGFD